MGEGTPFPPQRFRFHPRLSHSSAGQPETFPVVRLPPTFSPSPVFWSVGLPSRFRPLLSPPSEAFAFRDFPQSCEASAPFPPKGTEAGLAASRGKQHGCRAAPRKTGAASSAAPDGDGLFPAPSPDGRRRTAAVTARPEGGMKKAPDVPSSKGTPGAQKGLASSASPYPAPDAMQRAPCALPGRRTALKEGSAGGGNVLRKGGSPPTFPSPFYFLLIICSGARMSSSFSRLSRLRARTRSTTEPPVSRASLAMAADVS